MTRSTSSSSERVRQPLLDRHLEVEAEPLGVLAGDFGRLRREVGGGDPQVGALVEQGQGDGAGAGADLVDAGALGQLGGDLDQEPGLAARDQDPRVDGDVDPLEALVAEDVGERLVLGAAPDALLDRARQLRRSSPAPSSESRSTSIPSAAATRASASERGSIATGGGDRLLGFLDGLADRRSGRRSCLTLSCHRAKPPSAFRI